MSDFGASTGAQQNSYPNLNPSANGVNSTNSTAPNGSTAQNLKDSVINSESAYNTVANHPVTQNIANGVVSSSSGTLGNITVQLLTPHSPVAESARVQADKTSNEFSNVLASKKTPDTPAATGQPLTHYHSLFYNILSWENPRITAISFASIVAIIFVTRYVPILRIFFKGTYIVLGVIAAAEVAGKLIFDQGLASRLRPRKYYTIPRESLERSLEDVEQLINFFVIEFQRIIFAENVYATIAAFTSALVSFLLVKFVPKWGIALIATSIVYLGPLIYIKNKDLIDGHVNNASSVINQQATQVRDLASHHTARASEVAKSTVSEYSAKAQDLIGQGKARAASPSAPNPANVNPLKDEPHRDISREDFPSAPATAPSSTSNSAPAFEAPTTEIPASSFEQKAEHAY